LLVDVFVIAAMMERGPLVLTSKSRKGKVRFQGPTVGLDLGNLIHRNTIKGPA
jgi:hypothetical protein